MLIPVLFIIALAAALIGFAAGLGLAQALLLFVAAYLLANLICVLLAFSTCLLVKDMEKPIEKENPACRLAAVTAFGLVCGYLGVRAKTIGQQLLPQDDKYLVVCNHRSGFDPVVMMYQLRRHKVSFVAKPSVMSLPIIGRVAYGIGCLSIDRENDRNALKTILTAANYLKKGICNICIFPEGTRSRTGEMLPFHAGSFKIAQRAGKPLVIAAMTGTESITKNALRRRTDVVLKIIEVVPADKVKAMNTQELADYSAELIAKHIEEGLR